MEKFTLYDKNILDELYEEATIKESFDLDDLLKLPVNEEYKKYNEGKEQPNYKGFKEEVKAEQIELDKLPTHYEKVCTPSLKFPHLQNLTIEIEDSNYKENLKVTFDENKYLKSSYR